MNYFRGVIRMFAANGVALFIAWTVGLTCSVRAESRFMVDVWTPYDGLPQSSVISLAQTPDGYLWIAARLGWLARFDGIRFTHFNAENTPELLSPEILKLQVDDRMVAHQDQLVRGPEPQAAVRILRELQDLLLIRRESGRDA